MKSPCLASKGNSAAEKSRPTILIIDEDPDITRCLELVLANYDVNVIRDYCGRFGIWDVSQHKPDLVITDIRMPNGDGQELLEEVKSDPQLAQTPVIIFTGQRDPGLAGQLKRLGAASILYKPVHYQLLLQEIERFIPLEELDWAHAKPRSNG